MRSGTGQEERRRRGGGRGEGGREGGGREGGQADIKSNNPHLTGGEPFMWLNIPYMDGMGFAMLEKKHFPLGLIGSKKTSPQVWLKNRWNVTSVPTFRWLGHPTGAWMSQEVSKWLVSGL